MQKSQLFTSGNILLSSGRPRGACDSSSGTSGSYTGSVCVREDDVQTLYYERGRVEAAGEAGRKKTVKNRVAKRMH